MPNAFPFVLHVRAYAPFDTFGAVFHGDGSRKGATTSAAATARIHAWAGFDPTTGTHGMATAESDPSRFVGSKFSRRAKPKAFARGIKVAGGLFLQLDAWGSNPLAPGAPDIDVRVRADFSISRGSFCASLALEGDLFPNFEVFVADAAESRRMIQTFDTNGGRTTGPMVHLWGNRQSRLGGVCACFPVGAGGLFL